MYAVHLTTEAQTDILRLDPMLQTRILDKLQWLGDNALFVRRQLLEGDRWSGCLKYRIGDYRIIYQIDDALKRLTVLRAGHRRDIYR